MIDKSKRKANAQNFGDIVVIRMTGGPDCLWLNMYLDTKEWIMFCESDIGSYSYRFTKSTNRDCFLDLCIAWLADRKWLLRKCIDENQGEKCFDKEATVKNMLEMFEEYYSDENDEIPDYKGLLDNICYGDKDSWCTALDCFAPDYGVELPEEWWSYVVEDYTPWQKRFAEICREVIVPELEKLLKQVKTDA